MIETFTQRKNPRLQGYDYSLAGGYFVTICACKRGDVFGMIEGEEMVLNKIGEMAQLCWLEIPSHFQMVELDAFIVMPDHFHGIIFLTESDEGAGLVPARYGQTETTTVSRATTRVAPTLGRIIGSFKSISTNRYFSGVRDQAWPAIEKKLWRRGCYDRIIRNDEELEYIRNYVMHNAIKQEPPVFFSEAYYETRT